MTLYRSKTLDPTIWQTERGSSDETRQDAFCERSSDIRIHMEAIRSGSASRTKQRRLRRSVYESNNDWMTSGKTTDFR